MPLKEDIPTSTGTDCTIHIEAQSLPFKILLDLCTGFTPKRGVQFVSVIQALKVGEEYGFEHLPQVVLPFMYKQAKSHAWGVFQFAAKQDFPALAAYAIDQLQHSPDFRGVSILDLNYRLLDEISSEYSARLVRNMTLFRKENGVTDWRQVSLNFPEIEEVSRVSRMPFPDSRPQSGPQSRHSSEYASIVLDMMGMSVRYVRKAGGCAVHDLSRCT
jgi:hypothetical protein